METKVCKKCGRELPIEEFYKDKRKKDGYSCWCKECFKQQQKQYYQEHKEEKAEYFKKRYQEHKKEKAEYDKQYRQEHKEERAEFDKHRYQSNKEAILEQKKQYYQTQMGRALNLVNGYSQSDKLYNRGECTLTPEWIIDNIFTKSCHWCGETDWHHRIVWS